MGVVHEFRAAADCPTDLRFLVGLRECAQINAWSGGSTTADAVVAKRVVDACISQAARRVEQQLVMDHKTRAAAQRSKPVYVAFEAGRLRPTPRSGSMSSAVGDELR